jgi:hypothetical protein
VLALALLLRILSAEPQAYVWNSGSPLRLSVGESVRIPVPKGVARIAVSGSVFDVRTIGNQTIVVTGAAEGKSTLLAWSVDGSRMAAPIEVFPRPVTEWDGRSRVRVMVGKPLLLHIPKLSRVAGSVGMGPYGLKILADGVVDLDAQSPGAGVLLGWRSDGTRFQIDLDLVAPISDASVRARADDRVMVTIPEELVDLREAPGDGGTLLIGTGASGAQYEISVTPVPKKR